jgi:hypothetical protein
MNKPAIHSQIAQPIREACQLRVDSARQRIVFEVALESDSYRRAIVIPGMRTGSVESAPFAQYEPAIAHAKRDEIVRNVQPKIRTHCLQLPHSTFHFAQRQPLVRRGVPVNHDSMVDKDFGPAS